MDYRKIFIRIIYASISIAVIAGVMILFVPRGNNVIGKLIGTAISTGMAAGLLLVALRWHETPRTRPLGTALGVLVSGIYVSIVSFIWLDLIKQPPIFSILEHKFEMTAMFLSFFGLPILVGATCIPHERGNVAGKVFLSVWLVILFSWLLDTWAGVGFIQKYVEYFTVPFMIFSPIALFVLIARNTKTRLVGIVMATLGCAALQIGASISGGNLENTPILLFASLFFGWTSAGLGLFNLITFRKEEFAVPWGEQAATLLCGIALASLCVVIWSEITHQPLHEMLGRISASSAILASAAVLTIIVTQLVRSLIIVDSGSSILTATCPRCSREVILPQGKSTCPFCNLQIKIRIESPGCRGCGYDLVGSIESNCCPECGELIVVQGDSD